MVFLPHDMGPQDSCWSETNIWEVKPKKQGSTTNDVVQVQSQSDCCHFNNGGDTDAGLGIGGIKDKICSTQFHTASI